MSPSSGFLNSYASFRARIQSSFFMLSSIATVIISPAKQSIIGAIYSFPSLHGTCVMSVSHFLLGASELKSPFRRFSGRCAFLSALVSPSGLLLLLCSRFPFLIALITVERETFMPRCSSANRILCIP